jgi:hypothetical protein
MITDNEMKGMWKEAAAALFQVSSWYLLEGTRDVTKTSVGVPAVPAEIRIREIPNKNQNSYLAVILYSVIHVPLFTVLLDVG